MSIDTLTPQIELLQEQIDNLEKSGFFTDNEIKSKATPLRMELAVLKHQRELCNFQTNLNNCVSSFEHFLQGVNYFYNPTDNKNIEVIDAEILTPNQIQA